MHQTNRSVPDRDGDEARAEWRFFRKIMFKEYNSITMDSVLSNLITNDTTGAAYPNLVTLTSVALTLPVTTATVERSFSDMKLIKICLRNRLGEESLDQIMHISIEGPDTLNYDELKEIVTHWKVQKSRRLII